jgi:hypothetical protein
MITAEYICCYIGHIFHISVIALMHGTFKSDCDKFLGKGWIFPAVVSEHFKVTFDIIMNIFDGEYFFHDKVFSF